MARRPGRKKADERDIQLTLPMSEHVSDIHTDIVDVHARTVGAVGMAVYYVLASYADKTTATCSPALGLLAEAAGISRSMVKRCLRKLEAAGLIAIEGHYTATGKQGVQLYTLLDASAEAVEQRRKARAGEVETRGTDRGPL
jgi:DNA-binding MarR family transcriptional regulator